MPPRLPVAGALAVAALVAVSAQNAPRDVALVVAGGTVVTVDAAGRIVRNGAVAIDGADIVGVDTAESIARQFRGRETIDASGQIVLPGLVNTHTHAAMVLYRGLADDLPLAEWLNNYIFPAEARTVSPEFVRAGTRLAVLEMIESGTTTFADMYYFEDEVAKETRAAGLRGVLGQTIIQFPVADAKTPADGLARAEEFITAFKNDPLITPAVAPHSMYTLDGPTLRAARELSKRATGRTLYILDEPTTGLHFHDIAQLLRVLERLRDEGNTVIVIEHNLDVIKTADWIVDLGPEGGDGGGEIVAVGTPEDVAAHPSSYTGEYLRKALAGTSAGEKRLAAGR